MKNFTPDPKFLPALQVLDELKSLAYKRYWRIEKIIYSRERPYGKFMAYYFYARPRGFAQIYLGIVYNRKTQGIYLGFMPLSEKITRMLYEDNRYNCWYFIPGMHHRMLVPFKDIPRLLRMPKQKRIAYLNAIIKDVYPISGGRYSCPGKYQKKVIRRHK